MKWTIIAPWALTLPLAVTHPASAQTALDRLEDLIRRQGAQAEGEDQPGEAAQAADRAKGARPQPGYLGVVVDDREDRGRGVRVLSVLPDGPAEKAGLRPDDLITGVGGTRVRSMDELAAVLETVPAGKTVPLELLRGQKATRIAVTPARPPAAAPPAAGAVEHPPAADQKVLIQQLLRRIEALERRVEALERALKQGHVAAK